MPKSGFEELEFNLQCPCCGFEERLPLNHLLDKVTFPCTNCGYSIDLRRDIDRQKLENDLETARQQDAEWQAGSNRKV